MENKIKIRQVESIQRRYDFFMDLEFDLKDTHMVIVESSHPEFKEGCRVDESLISDLSSDGYLIERL
jgi:hypothetical protein